MNKTHQQLIAVVRMMISEGTSVDDIIKGLRVQEISIIDAIKVIREALGISLGESKRLVTSNEGWQDVVMLAAPLHDESEEQFLRSIET